MRRRKNSRQQNTGAIPKWKKKIIALAVLAVATIGGMFYSVHEVMDAPNVVLKQHENTYVHIPTGATFEDVLKILQKQGLLEHPTYFRWAATYFDYPKNVKAGRYYITKGMSSKALIKLLASGKQAAVKVIITGGRTEEQLAARLGRQLEPDSLAFLTALTNNALLSKNGLKAQCALSLIIPDTYEIYWNCTPQQMAEQFGNNYNTFWNADRRKKADDIGLTPQQISALAAIVEQESKKKDERPIIAGVYINRLHKGQKLEADPTLVYALGNFCVNRVLNGYKDIDSPYNTYKYSGLPPGPICIPTANAIDAVLNYTKHNYLYFCAREDFSGYHNFATNYPKHLLNAHKYQKELNKRNIKT